MNERSSDIVVFAAVFGLFSVLAYVSVATGWGWQLRPVRFLVVGAIVVALPVVPTVTWRQRVGIVAVVVGLVLFAYGVSGGSIGCLGPQPEIGPATTTIEHEASYDWRTNELEVVHERDGERTRCTGSPPRSAVVAGYLATGGGLVGIRRTRDEN